MNPFSLQNKNILVTGASSGIGAQCCSALSSAGANLILLGRNEARLKNVSRKMEPGNHSTILYDLCDINGIESSISGILDRYDFVHGFIHSAGIDLTKPLSFLKDNDFQTIFKINVTSGFEIARILSKRKYCPLVGASYIFIASVMGSVGEPGKIAYSASKGALLAGCRSMALELAHKKIRINCISPAIVKTELVDELFNKLPENSVESIKKRHPLGLGHPDDVAKSCIFLLSDEAAWITGSNLVVDGGYSIH
ncbi:SDR family NAD(P)-dependent oxidoreductase [Bacteroidota bacterium]